MREYIPVMRARNRLEDGNLQFSDEFGDDIYHLVLLAYGNEKQARRARLVYLNERVKMLTGVK